MKTENDQKRGEKKTLPETIREISKSGTALTVSLVITLVGVAYNAGQQTHRIDTLEVDAQKTSEVITALAQLTQKMDRRLSILEDREARHDATRPPLPAHGAKPNQ